jgi:hypothetical protein
MRNKLIILFCILLVSCSYNKKEEYESNLVFQKISNYTETVDTICKGKEIVRDRETIHLIFENDTTSENNINIIDSINFSIVGKIKTSIALNEYSNRLVLDYSVPKNPKKDYHLLIHIDKKTLTDNYLNIDFFKRKIRLEYKLKYLSPFIYIKINKNKGIKILYSYCTLNQDE